MSGLWQLVESAFQQLESRQGYAPRPLQRRMAQFVCEQLEFRRSVMVEAPTGHAFVLMDALVRQVTDGAASLLDNYDYLILDEAHDFLDAAASALEFDLDWRFIQRLKAHALTLITQLEDNFPEDELPPTGLTESVRRLVNGFADKVELLYKAMVFPGTVPPEGVATRVAPESLARMRALRDAYCPD